MINQIGYQYLHLKDIESAIDVFRLNVSRIPEFWNVYEVSITGYFLSFCFLLIKEKLPNPPMMAI